MNDKYIGLILAAGFGTRLKPLTDYIPKPMVPICGTPVIEHAIYRLSKFGVNDIKINTHYLHEQVENFIELKFSNKNKGNTSGSRDTFSISTVYEPEILGTGGVYTQLSSWIEGKKIVVYNSDIISDINIEDLILKHESIKEAISTMVVSTYKEGTTPMYLNDKGFVVAIGEEDSNIDFSKYQKCSFLAVSIVTKGLIDYLPKKGFSTIISAYRKALQDKKIVNTLFHKGLWKDIGDNNAYQNFYIDLINYIKDKEDENKVGVKEVLSDLGLIDIV